MAQNVSEFRILGRVGKVHDTGKAVFVDIAANYNRKDGNEWKTSTYWNTVTFFGKKAERAKKFATGDLVHVTGRMRQESYEKDGTRVYATALIGESGSVLAKAADAAGEEE